jgi:CheY-like chemotaxis protein
MYVSVWAGGETDPVKSLLDDDPITLDALHACSEPAELTDLLARDEHEALAPWEKHRPDFSCLDLTIQHIDGYQVCRRVQTRTDAGQSFAVHDHTVWPSKLRAERAGASRRCDALSCRIFWEFREPLGLRRAAFIGSGCRIRWISSCGRWKIVSQRATFLALLNDIDRGLPTQPARRSGIL